MAATRRPVEALNYALDFTKNAPIQRQQARILDDVNKHIWMAAPWRWTLGNVGTITLVDAQQDYTLSAPIDMLYPVYSYFADGSTTPQYLVIEAKLPTSAVQVGQPDRLSYEGSNTWRFYPKPKVTGTKTCVIQYKKTSPNITVENSYTSGALVMDDEWFWVYELGVLWKAYMFADDERAGNARLGSDGKWEYSGLRAEFENGINYMRERERLPIFGFQTVPDPKVSK